MYFLGCVKLIIGIEVLSKIDFWIYVIMLNVKDNNRWVYMFLYNIIYNYNVIIENLKFDKNSIYDLLFIMVVLFVCLFGCWWFYVLFSF